MKTDKQIEKSEQKPEMIGEYQKKKDKFCQHCGQTIAALAEICPKCGVRVVPVPQNTKKDAGIAALISFLGCFILVPQIGYIYLGEMRKALISFIILWASIAVIFLISGILSWTIVCIPVSLALWVVIACLPFLVVYNVFKMAKGDELILSNLL